MDDQTLSISLPRCTSNHNAVYRHVLDADEKARTERLEMFDEFEEWHML